MSKYIEIGSHVEYEERGVKKTGVITGWQTRSSIGYTTHKLTIKPDDGGRTVTKITGTQYADRVSLVETCAKCGEGTTQGTAVDSRTVVCPGCYIPASDEDIEALERD